MKLFYVYRVTTDNRGNDYTPAHTLQNSYPEFDAEFVDGRITTNVTTGKRLGWIECPEAQAEEIKAEMVEFWPSAKLKYITNAEALEYMRGLTDYTEVETNKFELVAADADMNEAAVYLTI